MILRIKMFFRKEHSERGAALMIVLSIVTVLSILVMQFFHKAVIERNLANNLRNRFSAELLAESAVNITKLQMTLWAKAKGQLSSMAGGANIPIDVSAPFCSQFPELMSTSLLRMIFSEGGKEAAEKLAAEIKAKKEEERGESGKEEIKIGDVDVGGSLFGIGAFDKEKAEKFLKFEGDFAGVCSDESSKFNINMFASMDPSKPVLSGLNAYDSAKQLLVKILLSRRYRGLFPDGEREVSEIVRNIADYVDKNSEINEIGGVTRGNEDSLYTGVKWGYGAKNTKLISLSELNLIAGVDDKWLMPLLADGDAITIYGSDKINVCTASDDIVSALILDYANSSPSIPDIKEGDEADLKRLEAAVSAVKTGCGTLSPDIDNIVAEVNKALTTGTAVEEEGKTETEGPSASSVFASRITTEGSIYKIIGTGNAGDIEVAIKAVFDTSASLPEKWRLVYFHVE